MRKSILIIGLLFLQFCMYAQKNKADSLKALLSIEKQDSNRVKLLWNIAIAVNDYNPELGLSYGQEALYLAKKIKYKDGESRALGIIANSCLKIGNYPQALEFYVQKLKIEEQRDSPRELAGVILNIGIVYLYQEEFQTALLYYIKADSLVRINNIEDIKFNIAINLGDIYNRLNIHDSAFLYFKKSMDIANDVNDQNLIGMSMVGMGHSFSKAGNHTLAIQYYHDAINFLLAAKNEDIVCEAALGLARVFQVIGNSDSSLYYMDFTHDLAVKDGFISWQLEATNLLTEYYKSKHKSDSAFKYLQLVQILKDSLNSKEKVRELQVLSSNEQLRQATLLETAKRLKEERSQQLQLLFIGIFIPGLFLFTLFLSRKKVHVRVIKAMGIISLLMLFEYLTLLLHPRVLEITNHTPVLEILIFVCIAAILIPTHHKIERWLIERLTRKQIDDSQDKMEIITKKWVSKKPSPKPNSSEEGL